MHTWKHKRAAYVCCVRLNLHSNYFNKWFLSMLWKNFLIIFESLSGTFHLNKIYSINHYIFIPFFYIHDIFLIEIWHFMHSESRLFIFIHTKMEIKTQFSGWMKHFRVREVNDLTEHLCGKRIEPLVGNYNLKYW